MFSHIDQNMAGLKFPEHNFVFTEQFTELLNKLSNSQVELVEISGNDDVFVTALLPAKAGPVQGAERLMSMPLADRPGWQRVGLSTKVPALLPLLRTIRSSGGQVEHVYDY